MVDYTVLQSAMEEARLDALIATDPFNVTYLTGCLDPASWMRDAQDMSRMLTAISFPDRSFVIGGQPRHGFPGEAYFCEMVPQKRIEMLAQQLAARGLQRHRLGIDMDYAPVSLLDQLRVLLPEARFVSADNLLRKCRAVKNSDELACLQQAIVTAEEAFLSIRHSIKADTPVKDIAAAWAQEVHALGAFPVEAMPFDFIVQSVMTVQEGFKQERKFIDRLPVRLEAGVMTRLDLGVCYKGYFSDQKIVICVGEPAPEAVVIYKQHRERQEFMRATIKPGMTKRQVYDACVQHFTDLEQYCFWIHSIGLDLHEEPRVGNLLPSAVDYNEELTFEVGQVLALEPSWLVEDMYLLTEHGCERLSTLPQHIMVLG
jgi:Xaa-Pro aminopeptidase